MNQNKGKIGFTAGNFDLIHPGYIYAFNDAKRNCDYLIIFLHDNPSTERSKKYKPAIPLHERHQTLMALKSVDEVITYQTEDDLLRLIKFFNPDVRFLGDDYIGKRFTGDHLPIEVVYTTRSHGWSTTKLKNMITKMTMKQNPNILKEK